MFSLDDVLDYQPPSRRSGIELGKLIDDVAIHAALIEDVTESVVSPAQPEPDQAQMARICQQRGLILANALGAQLGPQSTGALKLWHADANEVSLSCRSIPHSKPYVDVRWDQQLKPSAATVALFLKAAEVLTGAEPEEVRRELTVCLDAARKDKSRDEASREFRGFRIECRQNQSFGGSGLASIQRRFGAYPEAIALPVIAVPEPIPACRDHWSRCRDNHDVLKTYPAIGEAQVACKSRANSMASYGNPDWPGLPFRETVSGTQAPRTGIITLMEDQARFQNGFGAMARVVVLCSYSLRDRVVVDVKVQQRA